MGDRSWGPDPVPPAPPTIEFTAGEIEQAIHRALEEREFRVIPALIKLLAAKDARRAQAVRESIEARLQVARAIHRGDR